MLTEMSRAPINAWFAASMMIGLEGQARGAGTPVLRVRYSLRF